MKTAADEMSLYSLNFVALFHGCAACCHVTGRINFFTTRQTVTVSHEHEDRCTEMKNLDRREQEDKENYSKKERDEKCTNKIAELAQA